VHDVNERRLCKISEEVEKFFFAGDFTFWRGTNRREIPRLPAAGWFGMATAHANKKKEGHGVPYPYEKNSLKPNMTRILFRR
jgi:hypothetical protein